MASMMLLIAGAVVFFSFPGRSKEDPATNGGFPGCSMSKGVIGATFRGLEGTNAVEFTFLGPAKPLGRELILIPITDSASVLTQSLIGGSFEEEIKHVDCAARSFKDLDILKLDDVPCGSGAAIVDNGPAVSLKQLAVSGTSAYLMLTVTVEKFQAQGTSVLSGVQVFSRLDNLPPAVTSVLGFEPQTVVVGFVNLPMGTHDISYGIFDGKSTNVFGHVCFRS